MEYAVGIGVALLVLLALVGAFALVARLAERRADRAFERDHPRPDDGAG